MDKGVETGNERTDKLKMTEQPSGKTMKNLNSTSVTRLESSPNDNDTRRPRRRRPQSSLVLLPWLLWLAQIPLGAWAQDDGSDMMEDDSSMLDPTLLMGDDGTGGADGMGRGGVGTLSGRHLSLRMQTLLALQELGMVVGVAFMMAFIMLLIVVSEKAIGSLRRRLTNSGEEQSDVEAVHPADLVGSFKRYKN